MEYEIFETDGGVVVMFLDLWGARGVLVYHSNGGWSFYPAESREWDSFHQQVYRNHRASKLTQEQLTLLEIPMPDFEQYRGVPAVRWKDNFPSSVAADQVPAGVRARLEAGPRSAWLLLMEDRYETSFGDGKYLYPEEAFWDRSVAEQHLDAINRGETDPEKREWYEYTLREVPLRIDAERGAVIAETDIARYEQFSVDSVVRLLRS